MPKCLKALSLDGKKSAAKLGHSFFMDQWGQSRLIFVLSACHPKHPSVQPEHWLQIKPGAWVTLSPCMPLAGRLQSRSFEVDMTQQMEAVAYFHSVTFCLSEAHAVLGQQLAHIDQLATPSHLTTLSHTANLLVTLILDRT